MEPSANQVSIELFKQAYPFSLSRDIDWGDMDAFQHVNNATYFRYFESVRIAFFNHIQLLVNLNEVDAIPVLASTECRYKLPLTYPETIIVGCQCEVETESSMIQTYGIFSQTQNRVTTTGSARIVVIDKNTGKKTLIPEKIKGHLSKQNSS